MTIQILGTGCPKCQALERNAKEAVTKSGIAADVVKVTDINAIMEMGVMVTPALAIDGTVKKAGKVLTTDEIISIIKGGKLNGRMLMFLRLRDRKADETDLLLFRRCEYRISRGHSRAKACENGFWQYDMSRSHGSGTVGVHRIRESVDQCRY